MEHPEQQHVSSSSSSPFYQTNKMAEQAIDYHALKNGLTDVLLFLTII